MDHIIDHPKFQDALLKLAGELDMDIGDVQKEAIGYIKELYTQQHPMAKLLSVKGFNYILSRAYSDNIDVDPKGIKNLMKLMRTNSVAFIMTHKTYLDTLVLISTLARFGMPVPYSFGGSNLAFPGLKQLGNHAGLIFIRRSFKDNVIYKAALRHYISTIIDKGDHLTWNIEGTRSRTGKIIYPQMGILKYIMEGRKQSSRDIKYVPVSIVYDLIPDVKEMTEQGKGNAKKSENVMEAVTYVRKLGHDYGRAAIRFGEPVEVDEHLNAIIPDLEEDSYSDKNTLPRFAFELIHKANTITPVTTVSLVCNVLLNDFALTKKEIEYKVNKLMTYIGEKKADVLIDRGNKIGVTIQTALNLLMAAGIVQKSRAGQRAQYSLAASEYLPATYYANMASGHLYHRAFIEMALVKIKNDHSENRILNFWKEIMELRNLFKFEFFYTNKAKFSTEIEDELKRFDPNWRQILTNPNGDISGLLVKQNLFVSRAILLSYLEANKIVCHSLNNWDTDDEFKDEDFIELCMFKGKELHWQSRITRLDSVSKPFLTNALRFAKNSKLTPVERKLDYNRLDDWMLQLEDISERLAFLKRIEVMPDLKLITGISSEKTRVPESGDGLLPKQTKKQEEGPHITAFFDMDRTLINDFSAKKFMQTRLFSGKTSVKEYLTQFATALVFSAGNRDFEILTKIAAVGVKGIPESVFAELGESVYNDFLATTIYPESRELIASHLDRGHRIVIISAATSYQIEPIAKELGIKDVYCTKMEVRKGKFTGRVAEMCWGEGKARAARNFAKKHDVDLSKSYFYTDSIEDYPLLEIVGNPIATNPDSALSQVAFENEWPILRFEEPVGKPVVNGFRTGLAVASIYPSAVRGLIRGAITMSRREAANATFASIGDLGTKLAGLEIAVKGKHNLEEIRPAVFCFNHQSAADFFILMKLIRNNITGVAKKELERTPVGPIFTALGAIYVDRADKSKAIAAMQPAVDALKNGISVVIAPEGTRSGSKELGAFKKGAFHMAMQAGVPIIPVVIKNAYMAMPKGSSMLKPTHIEVVVLDPVDTSLWKVKNLNQHIEDVRNMFVEELEN
ncbi:HAD-IB family hydrolase [Ulvibacter antarcticus]|uniref:1-acyl-sn-glycerol-3-phosphate acyltransferase n=1 Tax=Ulvibacter antarcticus TaxID=442714 RepID=A0A3L9YHM8_9FLAO|nr:HAD-IB family hydrolase [Ulvibacter antarcticus]RMA58699.1 putative phosphoserine phosphatase/1-acylglycerol-3-phosphate O-acyltransferase [Ulvibacter antarcticus]